jgi:hypothetical protein
LETISKRLRLDKRGVSNVIVAMLSLVLVVIISTNVIIWSSQMSHYDWEKTQEKIEIVSAQTGRNGALFTINNKGSLTAHVVSLWVIDSTQHKRYNVDIFINSGENSTYTRMDINLPSEDFLIKMITERGNMAILSQS